jgi:hypothetical protein
VELGAVGDAHEVVVPHVLKVQAPEPDFEFGWEGSEMPMEYLSDLYLVRITIEMAGRKLIFSAAPYLARQLSVRKVVSTLTSKRAEIYLSMAGAKQLVTRGLSWFRPGPYVQQWCARGTVLRCTVVLAEGSCKRGGRGGEVSRSLRFD